MTVNVTEVVEAGWLEKRRRREAADVAWWAASLAATVAAAAETREPAELVAWVLERCWDVLATTRANDDSPLVDTLTPREWLLLQLRFGLIDGHQRTLQEVGERFGVTRERIRQIEDKTLSRLRHFLGLYELSPVELVAAWKVHEDQAGKATR